MPKGFVRHLAWQDDPHKTCLVSGPELVPCGLRTAAEPVNMAERGNSPKEELGKVQNHGCFFDVFCYIKSLDAHTRNGSFRKIFRFGWKISGNEEYIQEVISKVMADRFEKDLWEDRSRQFERGYPQGLHRKRPGMRFQREFQRSRWDFWNCLTSKEITIFQ